MRACVLGAFRMSRDRQKVSASEMARYTHTYTHEGIGFVAGAAGSRASSCGNVDNESFLRVTAWSG